MGQLILYFCEFCVTCFRQFDLFKLKNKQSQIVICIERTAQSETKSVVCKVFLFNLIKFSIMNEFVLVKTKLSYLRCSFKPCNEIISLCQRLNVLLLFF